MVSFEVLSRVQRRTVRKDGRMKDESSPNSRLSKTLDSGLRVLELLSEKPHGLTITEVAEGLGVHRTVAHRFLYTLEAHRLVRRDRDRRFFLGPGLVPLADPVDRDLRSIAQPILEELADETVATAHLVTQEDPDTVRALLVVEPRRSRAHIAFRPGQLDPITVGSAGLAILAAGPPLPDERIEITRARTDGYAVTFGEIIPAVHGLSVRVPGGQEPALAIGVSVFKLDDPRHIASLVSKAAHELASVLT